MPRAVNGTYTLPAGNPVVTATVISSVWANTTLSDIGTVLTASLDRSGNGAMLAGLKLFDGAIGAPGLTWSTETTSGLYRAGAGDFRYSVGATDVVRIQVGAVTVTGTLSVTGIFSPLSIRTGDGAVGTPAWSFTSDPDTGIYRANPNEVRFAAGGVLSAFYDTTRFEMNGVQFRAADGLVGTPGISFGGDTNTGIWRNGSDYLAFSAGGLEIGSMRNVGGFVGFLVNGGQIYSSDGSSGSPGYSFFNDTNTGIYRVAADDIAIVTAGVIIAEWTSARMVSSGPIVGPNGVVGTVSFGFASDPATGMYRSGASTVAFAGGGVRGFQIDGGHAYLEDGAVGGPSLAFNNNLTTGIYRIGANNLGISCNGAKVFDVATTGCGIIGGLSLTTTLINADASAANPAYSFTADPDTGFYRDTANQIGIGLGGTTAGQIAQGSFTGTLTGYAAGPTGTVFYQRIGKHVSLWITASILGTSNSTSMTMTGLPAIIQPTNAKEGYVGRLSDNGNLLSGLFSVVGGTITFALLDSTIVVNRVQPNFTGFTNSGVKGVSAAMNLFYTVD